MPEQNVHGYKSTLMAQPYYDTTLEVFKSFYQLYQHLGRVKSLSETFCGTQLSNPSCCVVYVDLLVLMNLDEDLNLLHCTFLSFPFHHAPPPTRQMFVWDHPVKNTQFQPCFIVAPTRASSTVGWKKIIQMAIVYFAIFRSLHPFWFQLSLFFGRKQKWKSNFSTCFVPSMLLTLSHFSFLSFGTVRRLKWALLSLKRHFASRLLMIKHSMLLIAKTTWRSSKRFYSILLINCITTTTTRNETESLDAGLEEKSGDEALVTDRHHPLGSAEWISWQTKHIQLMNNLFLTNYYYQTLLPPWRSSPPPPRRRMGIVDE